MVNLPLTTLSQIQTCATTGKVSFTYKALRELALLELGLDEADVCDILKSLKASDFIERKRSKLSEEWLYIFKFYVDRTLVYLKLILREDCIIISFHEDHPHD